MNHSCTNNSQCCSKNCLAGFCAPPRPTCGQEGAICKNDSDCCTNQSLFCDTLNIVQHYQAPVYSRDYYYSPSKKQLFFISKNAYRLSEIGEDYGTCRSCFATNTRCDGIHPCCDPNAVCNTTSAGGTAKYCIIPSGYNASQYLFKNWIKYGRGEFEPEHNAVRSGSTALKISSASSDSYLMNAALRNVLKGEKNYLLEFWARSGESAGTSVRYAIIDIANQHYLDSSGNWISLDHGPDFVLSKPLTNEYSKISHAFTTLPGALIEVRLYNTKSGVAYVDDLSVSEINDFTISVWVKPSENQGNFARLFYQLGQEGANTQGLDWFFNSANFLNVSFYGTNESGNPARISHLLDLSDGNWHMVSVSVKRLGTYEIYVDGKLAASGAFRLGRLNSSSPFFIGASDSLGSNGFKGMIDEIRFYKRALSAEEISNHYKGLYQDKCGLNIQVFYKQSPSMNISQPIFNAQLRLRRQLPDTVLSLPFDNMPSANVTIDYSRFLLHSTVSAQWIKDGRIGGAYRFSSPSHKITVPSSLLSGVSDFSLVVWVKPEAASGSGVIMGNRHAGTGTSLLFADDSSLRFEVGSKSIAAPFVLESGKWAHIVASRQSGVGKLYVNGELVASGDLWGDASSSSKFTIGNSPASSQPFVGVIDEVLVFGRALSDAEVRALYNEAFTVANRQLSAQ
ncbi:MAG: LamG domain-containing protein [Candidatus Micrarchaeota archaeon]|nr:LamG domain-containing protein [Candidatus Micrarchaeota archaeon]